MRQTYIIKTIYICWNIKILFFYNEQLRRRLVQYFCWWLFVWDISYVWTVAVKTGGSLTCWRQKLLGTVAGGFPLVTGVKIPRRERNVGKFPQIFRAKVGRTKNMKIPAVLTSVCNTVIVSIFRSFNLCIIPLSLTWYFNKRLCLMWLSLSLCQK